jgi:glycosyltransferase involved in cell wall biosynthesis
MSFRPSILIDAFNLGLDTGTGVATYARNLTFAARDLGYETNILYGNHAAGRSRKLLREVTFFDQRTQQISKPRAWSKPVHFAFSMLGVSAKPVPITGQVITTQFKPRLPHFDTLWNAPDVFLKAQIQFAVMQFLAPKRMAVRFNHTIDLAHWTYPLPMVVPGARNIYTLHDLVPLRLPFTTLDNKRYYLSLLSLLAKRADHIVTVSETSRRDIINLLGIPETQVTNTYQSVEIPDAYATKPEDAVRREVEGTLNVKYKEYMLYFGAIEPKKNVARLVEAYLSTKTETPLVIVGKKDWDSDKAFGLLDSDATSYLEQIGSQTFRRRRIFQVDYAPYPLLVSLIRGAKAVLFPSLYEGFGLPVLESMTLGTPVLASSEGALPEVAGDGALLVDPYNVRAIADGIRLLDTDENQRGLLVSRGRKQATLFSPAAHAAKLKNVYDRVRMGPT